MKNKLLASSGDLQQLKELIKRFYFGTEINLICNKGDSWSVCNSQGVIEGVQVVIKNRRYRFEAINKGKTTVRD